MLLNGIAWVSAHGIPVWQLNQHQVYLKLSLFSQAAESAQAVCVTPLDLQSLGRE